MGMQPEEPTNAKKRQRNSTTIQHSTRVPSRKGAHEVGSIPKSSVETVVDGAADSPHEVLPFATTFINLASRKDRLEHMTSTLHKAGLPASRFKALTGKEVPISCVGVLWDSTLNSQFDQKTVPTILKMSDGERGCAASHACLWRAVADLPLDAPPLLILEDDVCLRPDFTKWCSVMVQTIHLNRAPADRNILLYLGAHVAAWRDGTRVDDEQNRQWSGGADLTTPGLKEAACAPSITRTAVAKSLSRHERPGLPHRVISSRR